MAGTLVLVLIAALPVIGVLTGQTHRLDASTLKAVSGLLVVILVVGAVGLVVARHQPGNPIGWLLLGAAGWIPLSIISSSYATYVYHSGHRGIPLLSPVALILGQLFTLVVAVFPLVTMLFPDGRLPSARWRWVLAAYLLFCLSLPVSLIVAVLAAPHLDVQAGGQIAPADSPPSWVALVFFGPVVLAWLGALGHQIGSWRRSSGERREQLKWLLSGTVLCAVLGIWAVATNSAIWEVAIVGLAALPVGIGIGILKYRLYDIDRIISRTLAYAIITGLLVGSMRGWCCWPRRCWGSPRRGRWPRPRWPRRRCSPRCGAGCSGWWTGGSTGPATTRTRRWPRSPPGSAAPWPWTRSAPTW